MRMLELHCDYVSYKPRQKALKSVAELSPDQKEGSRMENALVVFCSFEQGDDEAVAAQAAQEIKKNFGEVKAAGVLVYPYAHLSPNLAPPVEAQKLLSFLFSEVRKFAPDSKQSVFGYYKEFELKCKGHPLAELSKTVNKASLEAAAVKLGGEKVVVEKAAGAELHESESLKQESKMKSVFYVLSPDVTITPAKEFDYSKYPDLKKFADYEIGKVRAYAEEPPHIKLMKEHDLVNYEPASDSGHMRWLPKGLVVKKILERAITNLCVDAGAMQVETPIMYAYDHPTLKKYLDRFPARQYTVKSDDKDFFLRFAACFGQFLIKHDMTISYKDLPLKMFELTHYSFRREQSGELAGLKRLRCFTMPDMHTLARDLEGAKREFQEQYELCVAWNRLMGIEFETAFRSQTDFFNENKDWYKVMVKHIGKPTLLELFDVRYAYFITKFEFNFVDCANKASGLSTVQIDVENAETYDISYVSEDGKKHRPAILHASISGAIDRVLYALLEREAAKQKSGKTPMLPVGLSPVQVRLVPVSDKHNSTCEKMLKLLLAANVRADFDDRTETLQKKVREAETEWVPFVAVVGDKEVESGELSVRVRKSGAQEKMPADKLAERVKAESQGLPFERPIF